MRILVVAGDNGSAHATAAAIRDRGHDAYTALRLDDALRQMTESPPDAVLLDSLGSDAARRLREALGGRPAVVVALSWFSSAEDRRQARDAGVDLHLTKPVDPAVLARLLVQLHSTLRV